jgi:hypothetical protein
MMLQAALRHQRHIVDAPPHVKVSESERDLGELTPERRIILEACPNRPPLPFASPITIPAPS